eukprot:g34448.t1
MAEVSEDDALDPEVGGVVNQIYLRLIQHPKPRMYWEIDSLLKSRSKAFKSGVPNLERKTSCLCKAISKMKELVINFVKGRGGHVPVYINGADVEVVESFKFLRVNIRNNLSWSIHITAVVKKTYQ